MSWVSPASTDDPAFWYNEGNAIDELTGTYAETDIEPSFVTVTFTPNLSACTKIRVWTAGGVDPNDWDIDAYYDAGWNGLVDGVITDNQWVELDLPSMKTVSQVRLEFAYAGGEPHFGQLYEVQGYQFSDEFELTWCLGADPNA